MTLKKNCKTILFSRIGEFHRIESMYLEQQQMRVHLEAITPEDMLIHEAMYKPVKTGPPRYYAMGRTGIQFYPTSDRQYTLIARVHKVFEI